MVDVDNTFKVKWTQPKDDNGSLVQAMTPSQVQNVSDWWVSDEYTDDVLVRITATSTAWYIKVSDDWTLATANDTYIPLWIVEYFVVWKGQFISVFWWDFNITEML